MQDFKIFHQKFKYEELYIEKNNALALPNLDYENIAQSTLAVNNNNHYKYNSNIIIFSTISETPDLSKIIQSVETNITLGL